MILSISVTHPSFFSNLLALTDSGAMRGDFQLRQLDDDDDDDGTKVLYELCSMISQVLRTPPLQVSLSGPAVSYLLYPTASGSPASFASLFLGVSVALMLFGSVTFAIGIFLMPVVIGLVFLFYFVGLLYNLSEMGRAILWPCYSSTTSPDISGPVWRFL